MRNGPRRSPSATQRSARPLLPEMSEVPNTATVTAPNAYVNVFLAAGPAHDRRPNLYRICAVIQRSYHVSYAHIGESEFRNLVGGPGFEPGASRSRNLR